LNVYLFQPDKTWPLGHQRQIIMPAIRQTILQTRQSVLTMLVLFLPRDGMRKRGLCCGPVSVRPSVRPSVCLSVTFVHSIQMAEDIVELLCRPGSPIILVFWPRRHNPIPRGTPSAGAQNTRGGKILRFSTEIAFYLGNGTR